MLRFRIRKRSEEGSDDRKVEGENPHEDAQKVKSAVSKQWRKGASQVCLASKSGWTKAVQTQHLLRISALTTAPQNRADADLDVIDELFIRAGPFRAFNRNMRMYLARRAELATFHAGDHLFKAGEPATHVYIMLDGEVHVTQLPEGEEEDNGFMVLRNFDSLGQELLLDLDNKDYSTMWDCCAVVAAASHVAVVSRALLMEAWEEEGHPDMQQLTQFLHSIPALEVLGLEKLNSLALHARLRHVSKDGVVFRQDSEPDELYIVRSGFVRFLRHMCVPRTRDLVASHHKQLKTLKSLDPAYFASILHHADSLYPDRLEGADSAAAAADQSHVHPNGCMTHRARVQRAHPPTATATPAVVSGGTTPFTLPVLESKPSFRGTMRLWGGHSRSATDTPGETPHTPHVVEPEPEHIPRSQRRPTIPPLRASPIPQSVSLLGSCRMPRLRDDMPRLEMGFADLGTLGTGQCFGGLGSTEKGGRRNCSAIADTHLELIVLTKTDFQLRLSDKLARFIGSTAVHDFAISDDDIRVKLEASMRWELHKKTLVNHVLSEKATRNFRLYPAAASGGHS